MRIKFTVRDLLWLVVVVSLAVGWWTYANRRSRYQIVEMHDPEQAMIHDNQTGESWARFGKEPSWILLIDEP